MFDQMRRRSVTHLHLNSGLNVPFAAAAVVARALEPQRQHTLGVQQPSDAVGQLDFPARCFGLLADAIKNARRQNVATRHR